MIVVLRQRALGRDTFVTEFVEMIVVLYQRALGLDTFETECAEKSVALYQPALAFEHLDQNVKLNVGVRRESLALLQRGRSVSLDEHGHYAFWRLKSHRAA